MVALYDYTRNQSLVVVDLKTEMVLNVEETRGQFQLDSEEKHEAEELASNDQLVRGFSQQSRDESDDSALLFAHSEQGRSAAPIRHCIPATY